MRRPTAFALLAIFLAAFLTVPAAHAADDSTISVDLSCTRKGQARAEVQVLRIGLEDFHVGVRTWGFDPAVDGKTFVLEKAVSANLRLSAVGQGEGGSSYRYDFTVYVQGRSGGELAKGGGQAELKGSTIVGGDEWNPRFGRYHVVLNSPAVSLPPVGECTPLSGNAKVGEFSMVNPDAVGHPMEDVLAITIAVAAGAAVVSMIVAVVAIVVRRRRGRRRTSPSGLPPEGPTAPPSSPTRPAAQ